MTAAWTDRDALERRDLAGEYDPHTDPKGEPMSAHDGELDCLDSFTYGFLFALETAGMIRDTADMLYFLEKPRKWDAECDAWCEHNQPYENENGWDEWVATCETIQARP